MPLQNRVTPEGEVISHPARGLLMGNRGGRLHDTAKTLGPRRWISKSWIACRLAFRGRHREVMAPNGYTELFFLDEATALAAGHRPCFECRRADALRFAACWAKAGIVTGRAAAAEMDRLLHAERLDAGGGKRTVRARSGDLPDGVLVRGPSAPRLIWSGRTWAWTPDGYRDPQPPDPDLDVDVLTPPSIIAVLKAGYGPIVHESAQPAR
ncbi:MAG TPA: hypothetical protein VNK52_04585 [Hyphomicrobiaceae bacterium]|nr:hypothetical protein [Hyphomicrobiaceae bacterium]